jgi:ABC-type multidrug transport system ATPase subunit|tara:strand:+ start:217 stop:813 length:597 start_codon:yes stop_codon:yes gene_type:complete
VSETKINISKLTLSYGKNAFIKNLSIDLEAPSLIKVYGNNGAGKTSLLRYISGIFEGSINEEDCIIEASKGIKLMDNAPSLIEDLSVGENIKFFTKGMLYEEKQQNELLTKVGMDKFNRDIVGDLSSGMKKRIETAILIWKKPSIVCLDEPENFLDKDGVKIVRHIIKETIKSGGIVIYSSLDKETGDFNYDLRIDLN